MITFESALADCRAAASAGILLACDPEVRLARAMAWADDLLRAELVSEGLRDRLHAALQAEEGFL